ncbi:PREDICTED: olfactory receptor 2A2-like [Galeopterus variegatus]|uniref:Olfactory receptor n=1 Tax=Galeopterus variegatus TaxID=482537 RepID=A0ABM0Q1P1_GALVR|nr:PREDICTED: olfactory receptor 2A2-like [Galeopterus variegatus]
MGGNQSCITELILLGFQLGAEMEVLLFWVFSLLYVFSLMANGMILGLINLDPRLHTPMYFFLSHLAVIDISYICSNFPNMLENLMNLVWTNTSTECMILVVMSYDRFVVIWHPLQYTVIMNWRVCTVVSVTSWACGFFLALISLILLLRLPFCGPQEVNHFFCETLSVLKLACADTGTSEIFVFAGGAFVLVGPLYLITLSYLPILWTILKIQSKEGRKKTFYTCSSHLCVVGLYFGIAMMVYLVPDNSQQQEQQKVLTLFYSVFNPLLNPLIYSLRNDQVKGAFYRALWKKRTM